MTDILEYCSSQPLMHFESGETILIEGSKSGKLFILKQGQVEVIRRETQVSYVDEPGSIFGEMSVLLDMPHSATVKALSDVDAYVVGEAMQFLESRSEVAIHLATLLARRLYYTTTYLVDLQQQAEGKRRDLDVVDQILGSLLDETQEAGKPSKRQAAKED